MKISSPHNQRLKDLRKLARASQRARTGLFAAEGEDLVLAAAQAKRKAVEGFCVPGLAAAERSSAGEDSSAGERPSGLGLGGEATLVAAIAGFHEVQPDILAAVSTLGSGTRVIGVYEQRWQAPAGPLCVYLHGVGDPGNVGTVLRSALAFGASSVALGPGCADPHSPKAMRASMGAIFAVRLARVRGVDELPGEKVALVARAGRPAWELRPSGALTLLVGAERDGLPQEVVQACDHVAHIPIASESLNAAMAATVALYEMTRCSIRVHES